MVFAVLKSARNLSPACWDPDGKWFAVGMLEINVGSAASIFWGTGEAVRPRGPPPIHSSTVPAVDGSGVAIKPRPEEVRRAGEPSKT